MLPFLCGNNPIMHYVYSKLQAGNVRIKKSKPYFLQSPVSLNSSSVRKDFKIYDIKF